MRIGLFSNTYWPFTGGVPVAVDTMAEQLMAKGHKVSIITSTNAGEMKDPPYVHRINYLSLPGIPESRLKISNRNQWIWNLFWAIDTPLGGRIALSARDQIRHIVEDEAIDIIHVNQPFGLGLQALLVAKEKGIPCIYTFHTQYEHYLKGILVENPLISHIVSHYSYKFANSCDYVIAPSETIKTLLLKHHVRVPIKVIPTGVGNAFAYRGNRAFIRRKYNISKNTKVFITVSRLSSAKNVGAIIRAFSLIHGKEPDTHLLIVGDGREKAALEREAEKLGITDAVSFTGDIPRKNLPHYYAGADIFLFASRYESQGIVLIEAMATGLPIISFDIPAAREALKGSGASLVNNAEEMALKAVCLLKDKSLRREISICSREKSLLFDPSRLADETLKLYTYLITADNKRVSSIAQDLIIGNAGVS
ncbi:MAG: glycosyltransferase [Deltaproteobacteria bacterium]|nr:glycosyltransferase [Deltaproteobacteria bacterium]